MVDQPVNDKEQQNSRLQLLAQAIEKVESECSLKRLESTTINGNNTNSMAPVQSPDFLMQLLTQQNVAAMMAAAAAAAAQLQQQQHQQHQHKPEPISPPSTSSASSSVESPLDFSSRRSIDDVNECSSPVSPNPMVSNMFPFLLTNKNGKPTRPFKAYPRDPLMLPLGFCSTTVDQNHLLGEAASRLTSNRKRFAQNSEQKTKQPMTPSNTHFISSTGTQILQPPKKRHRTVTNEEIPTSPNPTKDSNQLDGNNVVKDDAYWERRRKNNEAAKRSRDARRVKEDEIAIRAALLEQENIKLRLELSQLKQETAKLRCMIHTNS